MTTIRLSKPSQLAPALRSLGKGMDRATIKALQRTARFGATQVALVSSKTVPRPRATGTYERSWIVTKIKDGAVLSNSAKHAIFVEIGHRPGRRPPVQAIIDWMKAKKIDKKLSRGLGRDKAGRFKSLGASSLRAIAFVIARKIGQKGTRGRYVLRRTMPIMAKRLPVELNMEFQREFRRQASRRGRG